MSAFAFVLLLYILYIYIYIAYIAYIAKYSISCFLKNSARRESWRRAATGILLGIAFQDLVFTEKSRVW